MSPLNQRRGEKGQRKRTLQATPRRCGPGPHDDGRAWPARAFVQQRRGAVARQGTRYKKPSDVTGGGPGASGGALSTQTDSRAAGQPGPDGPSDAYRIPRALVVLGSADDQDEMWDDDHAGRPTYSIANVALHDREGGRPSEGEIVCKQRLNAVECRLGIGSDYERNPIR